ncbi:glycoside hydrolase family 25 protein [Scatolibacter rhodanostii]|uniref:glycoside hydrolase family 25 protein n=1 Tax=Scatolibacter rhodanostii TaxID=2014781 RepID=UPI000C0846A5|nr:glycoside hydrolase family 25 protein [Scatolibacter rhodanostii]
MLRKKLENGIKRLNLSWLGWRAALLLIVIGLIVLIIQLVKVPVTLSDETAEDFAGDGQTLKIYIEDIYNGRTLIPEYDVDLNTYDLNQFSENKQGYKTYPNAKIGIDVSSHQQEIDWKKVKDSGIEFAIIRLGYRGMTEGGLFLDEFFHQNMEEALANDIPVGVYFFSQATSAKEAEEEAEFVLKEITEYQVSYPVVFDWETVISQEETPRTHNLDMEHLASFAEAFCKKVEEGGKTAAFYTNKHLGYSGFDLEHLKDYDMWYAEYQPKPSFYYNFQIWQYTESGQVPGISTGVDINLAFKSYE